MTRRAVLLSAFVAVVLFAGAADDAATQGCAMCRTALGGADDPLTQGIFRSILFLVSVPFVLLASVGGWLVYSLNRDPLAEAPDEGDDPSVRVVEFRRRLT